MSRLLPLLLVAVLAAGALPAVAQPVENLDLADIGPDQSNTDAANPNGASGGRINGLALNPEDPKVAYAASEWGGLWKSQDGGATWFHLPGHVPTATWAVAVSPDDGNRVVATSLYDGRVLSDAGIGVSLDAGNTWFQPAGATPPTGFCAEPERREEPAAYGISIDPDKPDEVYVGTNCGLAVSQDGGLTFSYRDPTPGDPADDVWDVVAHDGGILDVCGDDGHLRSVDGGQTWTAPTGVLRPPGGRCSLAISPEEDYVVFVVVGTRIFESADGGANWQTYANPAPQGRIPFVETNDREAGYDLWFGDVQLFRAACATPTPPAPGGALRCAASNNWVNAQAGAHFDAGHLVFDPAVNLDACPRLYSNDGGVYRQTRPADPACHDPLWEQPDVTPHALWLWDLDSARLPGSKQEAVYFGNQDTGLFGATDAPAADPAWNNAFCCDGFDVAAEPERVLTSLCCFINPPQTRLFVCSPGMTNCTAFDAGDYPPGTVIAFTTLDVLDNYGPAAYGLITTNGVFVTADVTANPVTWTQLGAANTPPTACGLQAASANGATTFYVKSGGCDGDRPGSLWSYAGTAAGGNWQPVQRNGTSAFGVFTVDPSDPNRLLAADLAGPVPGMVLSPDGGATWQPLSQLDTLMTGGGVFRYQNTRGPRFFTNQGGYPQPSLVAFSPQDPRVVLAGAVDAGVFLSLDGGSNWQLLTDPLTPGLSGIPHIPRPHHATFEHEASGRVRAYVGTKGRGTWRIEFSSPGPGTLVLVPVGWAFDYRDDDHHLDQHGLRLLAETLDDTATPTTLDWETHVRYHDQNSDDDYSWEVSHAVLDLDDAFTAHGESPWIDDDGGQSISLGSFSSPDLVDFEDAQVVLKGWSFDYDEADHHIDHLGLKLQDVVYDPVAGSISWTAVADFADDNFDDDYRWRYQWQVIASNRGGFRRVERSDGDAGGNDTDVAAVTSSALAGFQQAAVLLQGWSFDFSDSDHHVDRSALRISNVAYLPSGTVTWSAGLTYADQNSDDAYLWRYTALVFAFDGEPPVVRQDGPFDDDGGGDDRSFSQALP